MYTQRLPNLKVIEIIPADCAFAQSYLRQAIEEKNVATRYQSILEGIADAQAGNLTDLAAVKAKWLSR